MENSHKGLEFLFPQADIEIEKDENGNYLINK
jgi:hypothetical protein